MLRRVVLTVVLALHLGCVPVGARGRDAAEPEEPPPTDSDAAAEPLFAFHPDVAPLPIGSLVPDAELLDAGGHAIRLADLRGTTLVMTFFESRSPDPELCPVLLARLAEVRRSLHADLIDEIILVAVTVDPVFDTAEVLRARAESLPPGPPRWLFLRGDPEAVARLAAGFGVVAWRRGDGTIGHTLNTVVIDRRGRLVDQFPGTDGWSAPDLLAAASAAAR